MPAESYFSIFDNYSHFNRLCGTVAFAENVKGSDWISLVFAHPFPWNSKAPIASVNFISDGIHTHDGTCLVVPTVKMETLCSRFYAVISGTNGDIDMGSQYYLT